ncbi:MAG: efflux RND transporter periplasmic adaptor subunit [Spongiibacteraceae bacterium]|jgi:membrane fusion protein (multidrug efflux system)|nr:efflux RND transporter periplasmic adaptor subunit [Spongiibacteraceae bacterium]
MIRILAVVILVVAAAGTWWWVRDDNAAVTDNQAGNAPAVIVHEAATRQIADRTEALGTLRAQESVEITATVTETITELFFDDGQWVEAGAVLALLDQQEERAQLAEEQANLAEQERELQRLENLLKRNLAAKTEVDQRRTLVARSQHRLQEIQARIDDRTIRAPFSGRLGLREVSVGALVTPGTVITTLDDTRRLRLDFSVPAALIASIEIGQPVLATSQAFDQVFEGRVNAIDSRINPTSRSLLVRAMFDNPDGLLKPGLLMTVELLRQPRDALMVPEEALIARQDQKFLLIVDPTTLTVAERAVVTGTREPGWVEVVSGLQAGELVIQEGITIARPGGKVTIKTVAPSGSTAGTGPASQAGGLPG